jgi:hypothetical protein
MALPLIEVPKFTTELPSSGERIQFRPFVVREQKQLLMAVNADPEAQLQATEDLIRACTWDKVNPSRLPSYDVEHLFLQIRARSVGEAIDLRVGCTSCENKQDYKLDLTLVKVDKPQGHANTIDLGGNVLLKMRDPGLKAIDELRRNNSPDAMINLIAASIDSIWKGDEMFAAADYSAAELIEFVENFSPVNLSKVEQYFETLPVLRHNMEFTCTKCGAANHAVLEGLQSFFG